MTIKVSSISKTDCVSFKVMQKTPGLYVCANDEQYKFIVNDKNQVFYVRDNRFEIAEKCWEDENYSYLPLKSLTVTFNS